MDSLPNAVPPSVASDDSRDSAKQRIFSAVLSAALPGTGQLVMGKTQTGFWFLCSFCILVFMYWPLRLPKSWVGLQILIFAVMILGIVATWHALRTPSQRDLQGSHRWLVLLIPLAVLLSFAHCNWLLRASGVRPFSVPSTSMERTISQGDRIVVDFKRYRLSKPKSRDIIVIHMDGLFFIKRVMAVGGDVIEGKDGAIIVNGSRLAEPYVQHLGNPPLQLNEFGPVNIPAGKLFLMGDNRDVSRDSRTPEFGLVSEESVEGMALYIIGSKSHSDGTDLRWKEGSEK
jgi:signal peptidase I